MGIDSHRTDRGRSDHVAAVDTVRYFDCHGEEFDATGPAAMRVHRGWVYRLWSVGEGMFWHVQRASVHPIFAAWYDYMDGRWQHLHTFNNEDVAIMWLRLQGEA